MTIATTNKNYNSVSFNACIDIEYQTIGFIITSHYKGIYKKLYFESFNNACKCYKALSNKIESEN